MATSDNLLLLLNLRDDAYVLALRMLRNSADAEDAVQEAYLRISRLKTPLPPEDRRRTWFLCIVANATRDLIRANQRRRAHTTEAAMTAEAMRENVTSEELADLKELRGKALIALESLDEKFRLPVSLHYEQGLTHAQAAEILQMNEGTVRAYTSRGLEKLREQLSGKGTRAAPAMLTAALSFEKLAAPPGLAESIQTILFTAKPATAAAAGVTGAKVLGATIAVTLLIVAQRAFFNAPEPAPARALPPAPLVRPEFGDERPAAAPLPQNIRVLGAASYQPAGNVLGVVLSPDGRYVAACGDKFITVWETATARQVAHTVTKSYVWQVRFIDNGRKLIGLPDSFGFEPTGVMEWEWEAGTPRTFAEARDHKENLSGRLLELSPDEKLGLAPTGSANGADLGVVDLVNGKRLETLEPVSRRVAGLTFAIQAVSVSNDGKKVACVDDLIGWSSGARPSEDSRFTIWDWDTRRLLHEWKQKKSGYSRNRIDWLPDGEHLFLVTGDGRCNIVKAANGELVRSFHGAGALSRDGRKVVTYADSRVYVYDAATGAEESSAEIGEIKFPSMFTLSSDARYFAATMNTASFLLVDLKTNTRLAPVEGGHLKSPYCISYAQDGRTILYDGGFSFVYDDLGARLKTMKSTMYRIGENTLSHDGRLLLAHGQQGGKAEVWDTYTGKKLGDLGFSTNAVERIHVSRDSAWAFIEYEYNGQGRFYDLRTGVALGLLQGPKHSFFGPSLEVERCLWSKDGQTAYLADTAISMFMHDIGNKNALPQCHAGAFNPKTGARLFKFMDDKGQPIESVGDLDLNPSEDLLYVNSQPNGQDPKGRTQFLLNAADGTCVRRVDSPGKPARFSMDGTLLIGPAGAVDVASGKLLSVFEGAAVISPSRTQFVRLEPGTLIVGDTRTGKETWRCAVAPELTGAKPKRILWHPAEWQITIVPETGSAIVQVDFFRGTPGEPAPELEDRAKMQEAFAGAGRLSAISAVVRDHKTTVPVLMEIIGDADVKTAPVIRRSALLALERIAREQSRVAEVKKLLSEAALDESTASLAKDAVLRLAAFESTLLRKNAVKDPTPMTWPAQVDAPPADF